MPGRVQDADLHVAERDLLPVRERLVRILGLRGRVDVNGNAVLEREPAVPGDVVGVRVRLEHARDPHVPLLGLGEVRLDRVRGIDDHGLTRGLVADQVGRAAEIVVDELPKLHEKDPNSDPSAQRIATGHRDTSGARHLTCPKGLGETEMAGDHHALDFVRALADLQDLLVAVEPRDRGLLDEAVAAVDLQRLVHDPV